MKILILADYPESKSFKSIINLQKNIKKYEKDIKHIYFDEYNEGIKNKIYDGLQDANIILVSLIKSNLYNLLKDEIMMNSIKNNINIKTMFIYGAKSVLDEINVWETKIKFFKRVGVSKTSKEYTSSIINYILKNEL
ncbi:MAG: hypothetical protein ACTSQY_04170 [Candidatus Odinarchaeia archaeon]